MQSSSNTLKRKKKSDIVTVTLIVIAGILVIVFLMAYARSLGAKRGTYQPGLMTAYNSEQNKKLSQPTNDQKTMLFNLGVSESDGKLGSVNSITQYNSAPDAQDSSAQDYTFELIKGDAVLYSTNFSVDPSISETINDKKEIERLNPLFSSALAIKAPVVEEGTQIVIKDRSGNVVLTDTVKNVQVNNSKPDYQSIAGEDVPVE